MRITWMPLWHKIKAREEATLEELAVRRTWVVPLGMLFRTTATAKLLPSTTLTLSLGCLLTYISPLLLSSSPYNNMHLEKEILIKPKISWKYCNHNLANKENKLINKAYETIPQAKNKLVRKQYRDGYIYIWKWWAHSIVNRWKFNVWVTFHSNFSQWLFSYGYIMWGITF